MPRPSSLALCALAAAASTSFASQVIPATSSLIVWQGRTLTGLLPPYDSSVSFSWEGVQASFAVQQGTTSVSMVASSTFTGGDANLHVLVDGEVAANVTLANNVLNKTYTLVSGLSPSAPHNVTLWYITDPIAMDWPNLPADHFQTFHSFAVDGSFATEPLPQLSRKILIIGDSITAGNQIDKATCKPDHWGTYGAKICRSFGANCSTLAISGKGLYENCCDANITMSQLYRRILVGRDQPLFNDADFTPDLIMLNLGTNDENGSNHPNAPGWAQNFTATYVEFLANLTEIHGPIPIFAGTGPITDSYGPLVVNAIATAKRYGANAYFVNYTGAPLDGCGHPGWVGHEAMFEIVRPQIASVMGWS